MKNTIQNTWRKVRLSDLCEIKHGYAFRGEFFCDTTTKYSLVTPGNFAIGGGFKKNSKYYNGPIPENYVLVKNDLIVTMTDLSKQGDTLGYSALVPCSDRYLHNQRIGLVTITSPYAKKDYIYWLLRTRDYQHYIVNHASGSTVKHTAPKTILAYEFNLPPLTKQEIITNTLSVLDAKIAVNAKINHHLEEMAQAIFKSWFVDFEPFGGEMPDDWREELLGELCTTVTKGTTPTTLKKQFVQQGINFVKAESILDDHSIDFGKLAYIDDETNALLSRSVIQASDIIFTIAGTLGRFAFVSEDLLPANTNQAVAIIRADTSKINPVTLYSLFVGGLHSDFYTKNIQQAVQANLSLMTIKTLPVCLPPNETLAEYSALIHPLFGKIFQNYTENQRLATLRDSLLPRLMSGELSVADLDMVK